jgi:hypothetical protein
MELSRRDFIAYSVRCSLAALSCGMLGTSTTRAASADYYDAHRDALSGAFRQIVFAAQSIWKTEFGAERASAMAQEALGNFETLLAKFPDVGGERNWDTQFIPVAGWYVALYGPMKSAGKTAEDVGRLVYEMYRHELAATPREQTVKEGEDLFREEPLASMQQWAEWTQKRDYADNWVAEFVRGDGQEFDFGYNYSECGAVKFFRSQGVPELAPYMCLSDFLKSAALDSGLRRTKTLGQGDDVCDFRYKKGRPVLQNWATEIDLIRSRMRS